MELLLEKSRESYLEYFNIPKKAFLKKRILVTFIILILYGAILVSFSNMWLYVAIPFVALFGYKLPYLELMNRKNHEDLIKQHMFPTFLRYFIALIDTQGNVYQTIKATIPYMQEPLRSELIELVKKLDAKNVEDYDAFIEFGEFVGSSEAHMIMNMIHQFYDEGINKSDLEELERTVKNLQENKVNELIESKVMTIDKHANPILVYALTYIIVFTIVLFIAYFQDLPL